MTRKVKSEKRLHDSMCSAKQVISKLYFQNRNCVFQGLMGTIANFSVIKPFSSKHLYKHFKWLNLFSALSGPVFMLW